MRKAGKSRYTKLASLSPILKEYLGPNQSFPATVAGEESSSEVLMGKTIPKCHKNGSLQK